ncbi:Eukaryotic aspartyl protease family protein [Perilla frutescens var. hirtella]|uniref:Eukaryotic aspartyl protease family protein n=1 Tax=Perilla frutescens var. hirtella TaxID=608512 RepID=A0AAD4J780_PERFH|nr:Eukaryotic aspartyl protease family protein [Perilla frutescens var. hirtella]
MGKTSFIGAILVMILAVDAYAATPTPIYSSRLIHRFSDEARSLWGSAAKNLGGEETTSWPEKKSFGHMRVLLENDLKRQRLKLGSQNQLFVASQGGDTINYGNDMGWLHYTWIDIGTPNNSFLVALDTGSDMLWVPCDCIECAPLSLSYYNRLDKELGEYNPSHSNSSKNIPCSHELCDMGPNCESPKGHCPYSVQYLSDDTSSSGLLFEDQLHLASVEGNKQQSSIQAAVIVGCGSKQSGAYLDGIAPDGLMGLGPGDISVLSSLAKSGLVPHSFSFCYDKSYSGRLYFGDQGPASQRSTSFVQLKGDRDAYFVEVEDYCVGSSCLKLTGYKAQVDTGSSFTYLPSESYEQVVSEFHRQVNATRITVQDFENCYKARSLSLSNFPLMKLVFPMNQSFEIDNPLFQIADEQGGFYCLGIQRSDGDIGIIGQNLLMGYRLVFDWEKMKLGWSVSDCHDIEANGDEVHQPPSPSDVLPNPLPTNQQQQSPNGHAVAPAVAGRAPVNPSAASPPPAIHRYQFCTTSLLLFLCIAYVTYII